ncbi:MAG: sulfite exporter TauE/SafE family protein [Nanoarchaeota archaeon]|nr:sulfite exporter TauE/SafE family protein [Nanoarchaeota archaeon]
MDIITLLLTFGIGLTASFIGGIAGGGGGLISIPALIFLGLPANVAIATNRFGAVGFAGTTIYKFAKEKKIPYHLAPIFIILSVIGSIIGARLLIDFNPDILSKIVGVLIVAILPFMFIFKNKGLKKANPSKLMKYSGYIFYFMVAIYDGFFGAGAGIFVIYLFVFMLGLPLLESMGLDKITWVFNAVISTVIFAYYGIIDYQIGIVLLIGMMIGGYLGAHTAIKKGNKFVKIAFSVIVVLSAVKLLFF